MDFAAIVILVSSANILGVAVSRQLGRSLIYIKNSNGTKLLPCGTPQVNLTASDNSPLTQRLYNTIHLQFAYKNGVINSIKCLFKSIKITPFRSLLSILIDHLSVVMRLLSYYYLDTRTTVQISAFQQNLCNNRNNRYWSVVVHIVFFTLLENWSNSR